MRKLRKNKFLFSLALIGIIVFGAITAYAFDIVEDSEGGSPNTTNPNLTGTTKYEDSRFQGIRFSLVKSDGTTVATETYLLDSKINSTQPVKINSNECSYPSIANGKCSIKWSSNGVILKYAVRPLSELEDLFKNVSANGSTYSFPVSLTAKVSDNSSNSLQSLFNGISREENSSLSDEEFSDFAYALFNRLLEELGSSQTVDDFLVAGEANKLYDLFIVYEPVTRVLFDGVYYFGTSHELAIQGSDTDGGKLNGSDGKPVCKSPTATALCDIQSVLKKMIPCKAYLNGEIIDSMKEKGSTILIKKFPDGYYFKKIKLVYDTASTVCPRKKGEGTYILADNIVTDTNGVGIGVLWINDYYEADDVTCDTAKEDIGWNSSDDRRLQSAFESGGIDAIYELYPSGEIEYEDGNGSVDAKWFINQCTCYGVYDHYATKDLTTYQNQNQSAIDELSITLGSPDWFTVPQLYETKGSIIESKFDNGSFTSYNNEWQAYADDNDLKWTPWTSDYYLEDLQCGTQEEYWCDEFEEWYDDMRPQSYPTISRIKNVLRYGSNIYNDELQTMIDAYNLSYYPANGFRWTLDDNDRGSNYSYIKNCVDVDVTNCQSVINFYQQNEGTDLESLACDKLEDFDFSTYNNRYGTSITGQWFVSECGCTQPISYNCTPSYSLGNCTTSDDINYKDSSNGIIEDDYWNYCVFDDIGSYDITPHKESDHGSSLTYYESGLGSQYCEVYCIEDLNASLAKPNISVEAGSRFTWDYSTVRGSRTCRTKSVEWDEFESDLEAANDAIVDAYVDYQLEVLKQESINNATYFGPSTSCSCVTNESVDYPNQSRDCCVETETVTETHTITNLQVPCSQCQGSDKCIPLYFDSSQCHTDYEYTRTYTKCTRYETGVSNRYELYEADGVDFSVTSNYGNDKSDSWSGDTWCSGGTINTTKPTANVSGTKSNYDSAVSNANNIVNAMKKCYTWDENIVYNTNPQATIIYSDGINYTYRGDLLGTPSYLFSDQSNCVNDIVDQIKGCSGEYCNATSLSMKNCGGEDHYAQMTRSAMTVFTLQPGVYRYVLKSNHLSIHTSQLPLYNSSSLTTNYIDIGYSNFPVSFSASAGYYGTNYGRGQFDVEYSNLGHIESGRTAIDTVMSGNSISQGTNAEYGKWVCQYYVYEDLLEEGGGIDLIYRPIDLHNPFPDIDASNRNTGSNWCDYGGDCSYDNSYVQTYIYENRDVDYEEVYNIEPMYTFILTPAIIDEIREYNDENSYTSYTGVGESQYFDYVCRNGTGTACISEYLSHIIDITGAKNQPGTCVDDQYRNSNDSNSFYGCRY